MEFIYAFMLYGLLHGAYLLKRNEKTTPVIVSQQAIAIAKLQEIPDNIVRKERPLDEIKGELSEIIENTELSRDIRLCARDILIELKN